MGMTERTPNTPGEHPGTERAPKHRTPRPNGQPNGRTERPTGGALVTRLQRARTFALTVVVMLPPALNAQNIVEWAHSPNGLGLSWAWSWVAFAGLDLIAAVCVFETLIQTQKARKAGAFAALVWLFAGASAYAGYRHGTQPDVGRDVKWFFPLMALAGPLLLHLILTRTRKDVQVDAGKRLEHTPASAYGWQRWIPGVGAFGETYCAWRVGRLEGITRPAETIVRYRALRPDAGKFGVRVLKAMRVEADRLRANTERGPTSPNVQVGPSVPNGERRTAASGAKPNIGGKANAKRTPPTEQSPADPVAANMQRIRDAYGDWRTNIPSARKVGLLLGVSVSTGQDYRKRLIAERGTERTDTAPTDSDSDDPKEQSA